MSVVSVSTIWQLVCPTTAVNGLVTTTTRTLPPNFTPTNILNPIVLVTGAEAMSAVDGSIVPVPTGTILPPDTFGADGNPRLTIAVPVHTTLNVDVFPNPLPSPIADYRPNWTVTRDGSLISSVYFEATVDDHTRIVLTGFLLAVFIRNVIVSVDYLRRGRAKDKTLFYLLLASQLWGPVAFISIIAGILFPSASCTAVNIVTVISMGASSSLLITGILGIKAYRCLNRSKFVLLVTAALQIASLVFFFFDLMRTSSTRAFNGTCTMNTNTATFIPACVSVMFSETGFLSLCFLVAVWRSSKSPAAQGRLSLVLSEDNGTGTSPSLEPPGLNHGRRGWWDYVPDAEPQPTNPNQLPPIQRLRSHESGTSVLLARPMPASATWYGRLQHSLEVALVRSGLPSLGRQLRPYGVSFPLPDARETSSTSGLEKGLGRRPHTNTTFNSGIQAAVKLAAPKELDERRWSRRLPNVLRAVIRNELFYTTAVTVSCVVSAIVVTCAARTNTLFSPFVWLQVNWAITSCLVMRGYARVIKRHEREKALQAPILAGPGPLTGVTRGSWKDRTTGPPSLASLSLRGPRRERYSLDDEVLSDRGHGRTSIVSVNPSIKAAARGYSNPFSDFQSTRIAMSSEEDARSHGRLGSRTRASKTRAVSPAPWEEGRCIDVVQVEEPPDSPRLGMGTLFLPTSSVSPVTHPAGGPIGLKPPQPTPTGLNIASLVTESFGVTSSTNIRSPTTISFDPQSDASYSIIRRPKSHDSGN